MRLLFLLLILIANCAVAQDKYWITFKDKDIQGYNFEKNLSAETIQNRLRFGIPLHQYTDIPVNKKYIKELQSMGIAIISKSKWLNSVSVFLTPDQVARVSMLPIVSNVSGIDRRIQI